MSKDQKKRNRIARLARAKMHWLQRSLSPWTRQVLRSSFSGRPSLTSSATQKGDGGGLNQADSKQIPIKSGVSRLIRLKQYGQQVSARFPSLREKYRPQQFEPPREAPELSLATTAAQSAAEDGADRHEEPFTEGLEPELTMTDLRDLLETRQQHPSSQRSIAAEPIESVPSAAADQVPGSATTMAELREILASRQSEPQPAPAKSPAPRRIQRITPAQAIDAGPPARIPPRRARSKIEELPHRPNVVSMQGEDQGIFEATPALATPPEKPPLPGEEARVMADQDAGMSSQEPAQPGQAEAEPESESKPVQEPITSLQPKPEEESVPESPESRPGDPVVPDPPFDEAAINQKPAKARPSLHEQPIIQAKSTLVPHTETSVTTNPPSPAEIEPPTPGIPSTPEASEAPAMETKTGLEHPSGEMTGPPLQQPPASEPTPPPARSTAPHQAATEPEQPQPIQAERSAVGVERDQGVEPASDNVPSVSRVANPEDAVPVAGPKPGILKRVEAIRPAKVLQKTPAKRAEATMPRVSAIQSQSQRISRHVEQPEGDQKALATEPLSTGESPVSLIQQKTAPLPPSPEKGPTITAHRSQAAKPELPPLASQSPTMFTAQQQATSAQTKQAVVMRQETAAAVGSEIMEEIIEEAQPDQEISLDRLARQIYPLIRRRLAIERQQVSRW